MRAGRRCIFERFAATKLVLSNGLAAIPVAAGLLLLKINTLELIAGFSNFGFAVHLHKSLQSVLDQLVNVTTKRLQLLTLRQHFARLEQVVILRGAFISPNNSIIRI